MNAILTGRQDEILPANKAGSINGWWLFAGLCLIYMFSAWWIRTGIMTDDLYYASLNGKLSTDQIGSVIQWQHKIGLVSYFAVPIGLFLKVSLCSFCLTAGLLAVNIKASFRGIFKIALLAETAFIAAALLRLILLAFFHPVETLRQYQDFAPLSLYSLVDPVYVPGWLAYPLQTINVFEIGYCLALAAGLRSLTRQPFGRMIRIVLLSYGLGLLCWMTAVAFLNINLSS